MMAAAEVKPMRRRDTHAGFVNTGAAGMGAHAWNCVLPTARLRDEAIVVVA